MKTFLPSVPTRFPKRACQPYYHAVCLCVAPSHCPHRRPKAIMFLWPMRTWKNTSASFHQSFWISLKGYPSSNNVNKKQKNGGNRAAGTWTRAGKHSFSIQTCQRSAWFWKGCTSSRLWWCAVYRDNRIPRFDEIDTFIPTPKGLSSRKAPVNN